MRRLLLALAVMGLVTGAAYAQDLSGGVMIAHHPAGLAYTTETPIGGWCPLFGTMAGCDAQNNDNVSADGSGWVWYVVAAFLQDSQWCGVEFGLTYPEGLTGYVISEQGPCVPGQVLEIPGDFWPSSGQGTSLVTTDIPWSGNFKPVYWFGGYCYAPLTVQLGDNLGTPGPTAFANCNQEEFPADAYGAMGFGMAGVDACPEIPQPDPWACCLYDGTCILTLTLAECTAADGEWFEGMLCEAVVCPVPVVCCVDHVCYFVHEDECGALGGVLHPEFVSCTSVPSCEDLTPATPSNWGTIKAIYR